FAGEQYCTAFFHSYGLETVSLRYFNVFGPRQGWDSPYAAVVPRFIRALNNGDRPTIFGDGEQTRDFTYIDNVVEANLKALEAPAAPGNVYNVAAGDKTTVNQLLAMMCEAMKTSADPIFEPARNGDVRDSLADISRARHDLGYERTVSVSEGLNRTITWATAQSA
ncbi:MAG: NAD-dependent epimerase/dehydratase family protein, partial [Gemmatimonadetes bacterium]|nr:NAD-dependent epimerase/dehydratase family protein [Gemmatimonadota bacterium]